MLRTATVDISQIPGLAAKQGPGLIGRITAIAVTSIVALGSIATAAVAKGRPILPWVTGILIAVLLIYVVERMTRFTETHGGLASVEGREAVDFERLRSKSSGPILPSPAVGPPAASTEERP